MDISNPSITIKTVHIHLHGSQGIPGELISLSAEKIIRDEVAATERFTLALDDLAVMDHKTGLMWARDVSDELTMEDAEAYGRNFRLGGFDDWYLATRNDRVEIIDDTRHNLAMHPLFRGCNDGEWTSTETAWSKAEKRTGSSRSFWCVLMDGGYVYGDHADYQLRARPVRRAVPAGQ